MNNAHGLTKENLLSTFPRALMENASIAALADVTMEALARRPAEIGLLSIYPRIDELPEELLDILAYDFKVDWWDRNYSIEEKRRTLKGSWYVHQHMGTKAAVETAVSAIYPETKVEEWFEYGGRPYHFRISIPIAGQSIDQDRPRQVVERVNFYKSLRSHLDEVITITAIPEKTLHITPVVGRGSSVTKLPALEPELPPVPVCVTPILGWGLGVTVLPSLEPELGTAVASVHPGAAAGSAMVTRLPPAEEFETARETLVRGKLSAALSGVMETKLPFAKEEF